MFQSPDRRIAGDREDDPSQAADGESPTLRGWSVSWPPNRGSWIGSREARRRSSASSAAPTTPCRATACRRCSGTRAGCRGRRPHRVQDVRSTSAKRNPVPRARLEEGAGRLDGAVRLHPRRRNGPHVGRRVHLVPSCTAYLALRRHRRDQELERQLHARTQPRSTARTVAIAAATSRCGSAHVTHDLVLLAEHRAVWTITGQIGIRTSSTSALATSETGRLTMRGKAVAFEAVQPRSGRRWRYARQPASA